MRVFVSAAVAFGLCAVTAFGQTTSGRPAPSRVELDSKYPTLKKGADEVARVTLSGDFGRLADLTHPKIVNLAGGRDKLIGLIKASIDGLQAQGFTIVSAEPGPPTVIEKIDKRLFAVMPIKTTMKGTAGKFQSLGTLVGISEDEGSGWTFVNALGQAHFDSLFPEAASKIKISSVTFEPIE
jgi:hypothetical protein